MFDTYIPAESLVCPVDGTPLSDWQGKDGPCAMLMWHEGQRYPADEWLNGAPRRLAAALEPFTLPPTFRICSWDCPRHHPIEALCTVANGVWSETRLIPPFGAGAPDRLTLHSQRTGRLREFILIDLSSQMPYIPSEARDWPRERLLSWLRVWGEIVGPIPVPARFTELLYLTYGFRSWVGLVTVFALTDEGRMFIPRTGIEAWIEPPE